MKSVLVKLSKPLPCNSISVLKIDLYGSGVSIYILLRVHTNYRTSLEVHAKYKQISSTENAKRELPGPDESDLSSFSQPRESEQA